MDALILACGVVTCIIGGVLWFKVRAAVNALAKTSCEFSENSAKSARDAVQRVEAAMSDALAKHLGDAELGRLAAYETMRAMLDDTRALNASFDSRADAHVQEVLEGMREMLDSASDVMRRMLDDTHTMVSNLDARAEAHDVGMRTQAGAAVVARIAADDACTTAEAAAGRAQSIADGVQRTAADAVERAQTALRDVLSAHLDEAKLDRHAAYEAIRAVLDGAQALNDSFDSRAAAHVQEVVVGMRQMLDAASLVSQQMLDDTHAMAADLDRRTEATTARFATQLAVAIEARAVAEAAAATAQQHLIDSQAKVAIALEEANAAVSRARHAAEAADAARQEAEAQAQKVRALPKGFGPESEAHPGFASRTGSPYDPVA
jgi:colicin import membrane protein